MQQLFWVGHLLLRIDILLSNRGSAVTMVVPRKIANWPRGKYKWNQILILFQYTESFATQQLSNAKEPLIYGPAIGRSPPLMMPAMKIHLLWFRRKVFGLKLFSTEHAIGKDIPVT